MYEPLTPIDWCVLLIAYVFALAVILLTFTYEKIRKGVTNHDSK
jgi:hypothetical protein